MKFVKEASAWGLTVSLEKTKGMALGEGLDDRDVAPVQVEEGMIQMVDSFIYLSSILSKDGDVMDDIKGRIAKTSRAFGCLRVPIFSNPVLSVDTKRAVYEAVILAMLFYGAKT